MSKTSELLLELNNLGFNISKDNTTVECTTENAIVYYNKYYRDRKYVLGQIPAFNEDINFIDFDLCFDVIEKCNGLDSEFYNYLHEKVHVNDIDNFILFLDILPSDLKEDLVYELEESKGFIHEEITEILNDLK